MSTLNRELQKNYKLLTISVNNVYNINKKILVYNKGYLRTEQASVAPRLWFGKRCGIRRPTR